MLTRITVALSVFCLVLPATAFAQGFTQGDKEFLLTGAGTSDSDFDSTLFSVEGSLGYFFTKNIEGAIRQALSLSDIEGVGSSWAASTRLALDFHFDLGRWWPFIGANGGYIYGDDVSDDWEVGLEGGLKFFVNNTTFVMGMAAYEWFLDDDDDGGFDDGQWIYSIGIGFRW